MATRGATGISACMLVTLMALPAGSALELSVPAVGSGAPGLLQAPASKVAKESWYGPMTGVAFQPHRYFDGTFSLEYPKKDWTSLPLGGPVLLVLAQKSGEATVIVEHELMPVSLEPSDITDLFGELEAGKLRERQPRAADIESQLITTAKGRVVALGFTRPGPTRTRQERVRQYSMPLGRHLYRLTCAADASRFPTYSQIFAHIAFSFTAVPGTE